MTTYVAWIEMDLSKIFRISSPDKKTRTLHRHEIKHHTSRDPKNHKDCDKFFQEIAGALKDADEILLAGPGLAKDHFKTYLERHHDKLHSKIVGTAALPWLNDERLMKRSQDFFKLYDIYGKQAAEAGTAVAHP